MSSPQELSKEGSITWLWPVEDVEPQPTYELQMAMAERPLKEQDCIVAMENQGVWAVFDGMGGHGDENAGKVASNLAANACRNAYSQEVGVGNNVQSEMLQMLDWLQSADRRISSQGRMGTTAVAIRLVEEDGRPFAVWANIGDSRLYLYRNSKLYLVSKDEGYGHVLENYLGKGRADIKQVGHFGLAPHDRLMLCSDGITGDYGADLLADEEIKSALDASTPQAAANLLIEKSRKRDDKSVVVVEMAGAGLKAESSTLQEHRLKSDEQYNFDTSKPLELRGNYNVVAQIRAADKELLVLDLRHAPTIGNNKVPFGESVGLWEADFLVVDESFFGKWGRPVRGQGGYKGIRIGETLNFGRSHSKERFVLSNQVSREHFSLDYDGNGLSISNHSPLNGTSITVKR